MRHSLFVLLILLMAIVNFGIEVNVVHEWKYCEYEWNSQKQKEDAINSGTFNTSKCIFFDVTRADDGRIFIAIPKYFGSDVPASLATVTNTTGPGGPLLRPYPDWSWYNRSCICDGIINVYRIHIQCNHIFVMDFGAVLNDQICNPKLLIFNLKDDTLVKTIYIPVDIAFNRTGSGSLIEPLVYVTKKCTGFLDKMIVFMADPVGFGLVVYDTSRKRMCRVESDYMKPTDASLSINGNNFPLDFGIYGMTIIGDDFYYAPLSGKEIYKIKVKTLIKCPNKEQANKLTKFVVKLSSQPTELTSIGHSIFYSLTSERSIVGTNVYKNSGNNTVVLAQDEKFQRLTAIEVLSYWGKLISLSNTFHRFYQGIIRLDEINLRIFYMDLAKIQKIMG
ncbi:PREDICTED: major royal jelly protein 5-like [Cyphomyrmex costatus]|uniref:major royal jelly protein 5-like n=1 Tax=Cyphomyrmex costatus TaxID=456900 RepID=UPI0008522C32|nr:PREDICTED: major royal jelly protein 5-like [Cyphomyrmex costatus]